MKKEILDVLNQVLCPCKMNGNDYIDGEFNLDDLAQKILDRLEKIIDIAESAIECCEQDLNQDWEEEKEFIQKIKGMS